MSRRARHARSACDSSNPALPIALRIEGRSSQNKASG